jgi:hypothetical protein
MYIIHILACRCNWWDALHNVLCYAVVFQPILGLYCLQPFHVQLMAVNVCQLLLIRQLSQPATRTSVRVVGCPWILRRKLTVHACMQRCFILHSAVFGQWLGTSHASARDTTTPSAALAVKPVAHRCQGSLHSACMQVYSALYFTRQCVHLNATMWHHARLPIPRRDVENITGTANFKLYGMQSR